MKLFRKLSVILLITITSGGFTFSKPVQAASKQELNWTENVEISSIDNAQATDTLSFNVLLNTQENLYRLDKKGKPQPALAEKTTISKDGKTYTFKIRPNAKWSNGDPITAKDFVYSWKRVVNPKTGAQNAFNFFQIKNAKEINSGKMALNKLGVSAPDNYTFVVNLARPVSYFKTLISWPLFAPENKKIVEKYGKAYGTTANKTVSSGPFVLKGWDGANGSWSLVKNPYYWDKKHVHLNKINESVVKDSQTGLNLYQNKKVQETVLVGEQVPQFKGQKDLIFRHASSGIRMDLNQEKIKAFKNRNVRRALSLAINRKQLTKRVLQDGSLEPKGFVPVGLAKDPSTGKDFAKQTEVKAAVTKNMPLAKKLLAKGLKATNTKKLDLELMVDDSPNTKKTGEFVQGQLEQLPKVKVHIKSLPKVQRITKEGKSDFDMVIATWTSTFSDPINFLDVWESDSTYNNSKWRNKKFDNYTELSENRYATNPAQRWTQLQKAEHELMNDQGTIPLYQVTQAQLLDTKVKGIIYNGSGVPYDWKYAYIK
ncbi:MAG: peptide ABC transporter substrate-binding protein [Lactobacillus sp.]|uniref:Peptide ABC transporter substrate-binding protein n=2 Tax=Bombilactobacillus bombi TaxID=1303590 RepID=A0A417ZJR3_9LACO|nr:peptide ABC transporter substrate-binding protein [Bombilactobacillus bombi]MCO6540738.1 peptide ABC transporter substrate-binding protein [Lactobacillus sp.]MCO6542385.1 peptide ABC transporter substrate-binding protein [Lactobacillus sp.]RHW52177.1 peptide ABC transporter substrate-binding protein [Bombilactobacillus bombi]